SQGRHWKSIGGVVLAVGGIIGTVLGGPLGSVVGSLSEQEMWIAVAFAVSAFVALAGNLIYTRNHVSSADIKKLVDRIEVFDQEVGQVTSKLQVTIDSAQALMRAMTSGEKKLAEAVATIQGEREAFGAIIVSAEQVAASIQRELPAFEAFLEKDSTDSIKLAARLESVYEEFSKMIIRAETAARAVAHQLTEADEETGLITHLSAEAASAGVRARGAEDQLQKFQVKLTDQREVLSAIRGWESTVVALGEQVNALMLQRKSMIEDAKRMKGGSV
ncbi:MAG: hypothetical protein WCN87_04760, partial [Chlamydiota bacterium]